MRTIPQLNLSIVRMEEVEMMVMDLELGLMKRRLPYKSLVHRGINCLKNSSTCCYNNHAKDEDVESLIYYCCDDCRGETKGYGEHRLE